MSSPFFKFLGIFLSNFQDFCSFMQMSMTGESPAPHKILSKRLEKLLPFLSKCVILSIACRLHPLPRQPCKSHSGVKMSQKYQHGIKNEYACIVKWI